MLSLLTLAALPLALAAPMINAPNVPSTANKYIVIMNPAANNLQSRSTAATAFSSIHKEHIYESDSFSGFAARLTSQQVETLKSDSSVAYVEQDGWLSTQDVRGSHREMTTTDVNMMTQANSTWGLGRLSHMTPGSSDYLYDASAGADTCSYIIDTGVMFNHTEFEDRAMLLTNFDKIDNTTDDLFGHGTHVAGTIGAKTFGVAKKTKIIGIKVCNQYGLCMMSDIMAAMLLAIKDSKERAAAGTACTKGAVINMSLGAPNSDWRAIKLTVKSVTDAGLFMAIAAGNQFKDAKDFSPASAETSCTVGAIDSRDKMAKFSNFGENVSVFAPGVDVLSLSPLNDKATALMSGTSMASPHIAGLAAYMLGMSGNMDPLALCQKIKDNAHKDLIMNLPKNVTTVNLIAYNAIA